MVAPPALDTSYVAPCVSSRWSGCLGRYLGLPATVCKAVLPARSLRRVPSVSSPRRGREFGAHGKAARLLLD